MLTFTFVYLFCLLPEIQIKTAIEEWKEWNKGKAKMIISYIKADACLFLSCSIDHFCLPKNVKY